MKVFGLQGEIMRSVRLADKTFEPGVSPFFHASAGINER